MAKKPVKQAATDAAGDETHLQTVKVTRVVEVAGFVYKPGHDHAVDATTLDALVAAGAIANVRSTS